ncbi:MAG: hypothetical protein K8F91_05040 [Candidatus Obscuribacterales bacterium]|nr:hypothetical protein [Candidatus Obscuribacterales bacterium]
MSEEDIPVVDAEPVESSSGSSTGWGGALVHSFGHGLIQAPIDGVREVVNKMAGTKVIPKVQLVQPPDRHEITSAEWQASKVGAGAGLLAAGLVVIKLISRGRII